VFPNK
jgi:DNA polymerase epsilon subunit 1